MGKPIGNRILTPASGLITPANVGALNGVDRRFTERSAGHRPVAHCKSEVNHLNHWHGDNYMTQQYNLLPRAGPSLAEEWLEIGLNHHCAGRMAEAEQAYLKGLRLDPACVRIMTNLGVLTAQLVDAIVTVKTDTMIFALPQGQMLTALQYFERAVLFDDTDQVLSVTWYDYALALLDAGRVDEALPAIEQSLKRGESAAALCAKAMILTSLARAAEAIEVYDRALEIDPKHPQSSYNAMFVRTLKNTTPEDNHAARRRWHDNHRWTGERKPHDNDKTPDRPLRVGYVGGDFKMHSAAYIFGAVIFHHDRKIIEPYCYMTMAPGDDATTRKFMAASTWRDISAKNDDEAEAMIRADKIDILVELSGHTGGNRLPLFTRKPAPVQCHGWGFAHGTGCPEIDYFLADLYAVPQDERIHYSEKIWDLPAIVGYDPPADYGQSGTSLPPSARGVFTFGVFGRFEKYSPQALEAWHKIMLRTPGSRLLVKDAAMRKPHVIRRIREVLHDIDQKRILFMQDSSHLEQMLAYQGVDLVLDTFPHTGGVTSLEMLYMGVPVVTLYNGQPGGRTTSVALRAMGRQGWIAKSIDEYVKKAVKLAEERGEVAKARGALRDELLKSPLCDGYAGSVEQAYRMMWWRYCGHDVADSRHTDSSRVGASSSSLRDDDCAKQAGTN